MIKFGHPGLSGLFLWFHYILPIADLPTTSNCFSLHFWGTLTVVKDILLRVHLQSPHCGSLTSHTPYIPIIIFIHTKSVEIPTELSHIGPPTHPKYFSNFPNKSGRSSAEDSSIYPSLMIPSRDGEPSAQSKVRVLQGKKNVSHILWFICKNNEWRLQRHSHYTLS